jgi:hypothetical protein
MKRAHRISLVLTLILFVSGCGELSRQDDTAASSSVHLSSTSGAARAASGGTSGIPDSLISLNKMFLEGYRQRQVAVKTNTSPVIVADFSALILHWNGMAETNRCIPDIYQALKAVAHVPFGIFLRVDPCANDPETPVPDFVLQGLILYRDQINAAEASLSQAGFSESQLVRQEQILGACKSYLARVIGNAKASRKELMSFARTVGPWLLDNANDAARAQLDLTHAVVTQWKKRIPVNEWGRLIVVVRGPQMPRRMNILTQYFAKVLGEPSHHLGYPLESRRLIYAELIFNNRDHLDLMATTLIDGEASDAFFGDRWRMSRDLLADGAEEYLKHLSFD